MLSGAARPHEERLVRRAVSIGVVIGALISLWMTTAGTFDLVRWRPLGDFYDAQAEAWLDGTWEIGIDTLTIESFFRFDEEAQQFLASGWATSDDLLGIEAFFRDQPAYMYQGPVPAVFRLPTALLAPGLRGHLTALSILVASCTSGWLAGRLAWVTRTLIRPDAPVDRTEQVALAVGALLVVGGSNLVYLAAKPWVYHEALAWGVAFCLASLLALIRYIHEPSSRRLLFVGMLVTAGMLTRVSVGMGPVLAVVALGVGQALAELRDRSGDRLAWLDHLAWAAPPTRGWKPFVGMVTVVVAAVGSYAAVNVIKFHTLFSIRFDWQFFTIVDRDRRLFLAENGGFFSPTFIPTTLVQYFRPDAVRFTSLFPWIEFDHAPGWVFGGVRLDLFDRTASVPTAMPVFVLLGVVAAIAVLRRWLRGTDLRPLAVPLLGAAASGLTVLPFGYIANRYLADFMPFLVLVGAVGLQAWLHRRPEMSRTTRRAVPTMLLIAAAFGMWVNLSHGLLFQRLYSTVVDEERTAAFIATQQRIDEWRPGGGDTLANRLAWGDSLPLGSSGDLFAIGECDALYFHDGVQPNDVRHTSWIPVERTQAGGRYELSITFADNEPGTRVPLFSSGGGEGPALLTVETTDDGRRLFEYIGAGLASRGQPIEIEPGRAYDAVLVVDPRVETVSLSLDGRTRFETYFSHPEPIVLGRNVVGGDAAPSFDGEIEVLDDTPAVLCEQLLERARELDG